MSKAKTKEDVITHKTAAIDKLNTFLDTLIESDDKSKLKKADLLSYWIEQYASYIETENDFEPAKLKSYKRGDIIKVNFGFNVGSEYGGLHYAIVINNSNPHNSSVITVVPLTSIKSEEKVHDDDVLLGNEIYKSLKMK